MVEELFGDVVKVLSDVECYVCFLEFCDWVVCGGNVVVVFEVIELIEKWFENV